MFYINQEIDKCDYWVVFDGLIEKESVICSKENTLLVTGEPPDIKKYNLNFIKQFGRVLTSHRDINHPNVIYSQQGLPWMIGAEYDLGTNKWSNFKKFEELEKSRIVKNKLLSVIVSNKLKSPGHKLRDQFIRHLADIFGDEIDIFGVGRNPIKDKWDAIAPYKYHLVMENSFVKDYWTEKLSDAFIGEALPLYSGCPNINRYFPGDSLQRVDIRNYKMATEKIASIVHSNEYENRILSIKSSKNKVLYEYNIFSVIYDIVKTSNPSATNVKSAISIFPEKNYHQKNRLLTLCYKLLGKHH